MDAWLAPYRRLWTQSLDDLEAYGLDMTPSLSGEIRDWDPPKVFEWAWDTDLLRWELVPDGDGTVLTFTTWLGEVGHPVEKTAAGRSWPPHTAGYLR